MKSPILKSLRARYPRVEIYHMMTLSLNLSYTLPRLAQPGQPLWPWPLPLLPNPSGLSNYTGNSHAHKAWLPSLILSQLLTLWLSSSVTKARFQQRLQCSLCNQSQSSVLIQSMKPKEILAFSAATWTSLVK